MYPFSDRRLYLARYSWIRTINGKKSRRTWAGFVLPLGVPPMLRDSLSKSFSKCLESTWHRHELDRHRDGQSDISLEAEEPEIIAFFPEAHILTQTLLVRVCLRMKTQ